MKAGIIQAGAVAVAISAVFGLFIMVGWDVPPYSSMARAESLEQAVKVQNQQLLENSLFVWESKRDDAEDDLQTEPNDVRAKRDLRRSEKMIDKIECQLGIGVNCKE